ncbi:hypothetical protein ARMGADRAFT_545905 [Armillaria gallica]|uniref:Uncharacterized protein n=1 Tax=Armillaria gallica TaxID=47427 RepID=A0A2H3DEE8_ARMGA|nr:hypothetical protein ARMGADRAFT_545905 [Armillaria gallica]
MFGVRRPVYIPRHTTRSHFFHAHPPRPWMDICAKLRRVSYPMLARIDNLPSLSLPSFDLHILRHHSAFWTTPYRYPFLVDADDEASGSPPTPLPATPTCTRSHHAMSIPHASAIADSGHLHAYRRQSSLEYHHFPRPSAYCGHSVPKSYTLSMLCSQYYCSPRPCTSCYPPGAVVSSSRGVYHHFHPDQSWVRYVLTLKNSR